MDTQSVSRNMSERMDLPFVGLATFARNCTVVLAATLLFQRGSTLFSNLPIIVLTILCTHHAAPFAIRLRGCYGSGLLLAFWLHT